jgi:hypothetical protein
MRQVLAEVHGSVKQQRTWRRGVSNRDQMTKPAVSRHN